MKKVNKYSNLLCVLALSIMLSLTMLVHIKFDSSAASTTTFNVTGTFNQTSARNMLPIINSYRQSGSAWILDQKNNRQNLGKLSALTYDYNLEKIAMQRAMEISVRYDAAHMRPDNTKYFTCTYSSTSTFGE